MSDQATAANGNGGFLGTVERIGNKLPDPAVLFIALLFIVWILSWLLSYVTFDVIDPRSGLSLIHISEPTRRRDSSRMPSSA